MAMLDDVRPDAAGLDAQAADPQAEREAQQVEAQIKQFEGWISATKKKDRAAHKRIREDMDFAFKFGVGKQWPDQSENDPRYIANIVQRHVQSRVAALYAKEPVVVAKRNRRREHMVWDGSAETLVGAHDRIRQAGQTGMPPNADDIEIVQDFNQGFTSKAQQDAIGDTLEIVFSYQLSEPEPAFKQQMKQFVRRVQTCGLAWVRLGYQRKMGRRAFTDTRISDVQDRMQRVEALQEKLKTEGTEDNQQHDAEMAELRQSLKALQEEEENIIREGLVFHFPRTTRVLVDPACTDLISLVGARWMSEEYELTTDEVQETYGVDIRKAFTSAETDMTENDRAPGDERHEADANKALVYHLFDRKTGLEYVFCKGHKKYLREPAVPKVRVERFFPYYPLAFNAVEHDDERYPASDVRLLRHAQMEYNRLKETLRQHRIANRPLYVAATGAFERSDIENGDVPSLSNYEAHDVILLQGLAQGENIGAKLQSVQKIGIDPNLYETGTIMSDVERVAGTQEATLGGTSKATATESTIAEGSRLSSLASNVDDLDDLLSALARDGGAVLLMEMDSTTVASIVGPGAVWPKLSREQIAKQVYLEIEAGSSGRPNKAQDLANFERAAPFILQIPGITPEWLARHVLKLVDDRIDLEQAVGEGLPSIVAMNQQAQPSTGDASTDPAQQGGRGAANAEQQPSTTPGPQAAFPTSSVA